MGKFQSYNMKPLSFTTMDCVLSSWEQVRRIPNYRETVGLAILQKLIHRMPEGREVLHMQRNLIKNSPPGIESDKLLLAHARAIVNGLDTVVELLGPLIDDISEILREIGKSQYHDYGDSMALWNPLMRECVLEVIQETLKDDYTHELKVAWTDFLGEVAKDIHSGEIRLKMIQETRHRTFNALSA